MHHAWIAIPYKTGYKIRVGQFSKIWSHIYVSQLTASHEGITTYIAIASTFNIKNIKHMPSSYYS